MSDVDFSDLLGGGSESKPSRSEINRRNRMSNPLRSHPLRDLHRALTRRCHESGTTFHEPWLVLAVFIVEIEGEIGPRPTPRHWLVTREASLGFIPGNVYWEFRPPRISRRRARAEALSGPHQDCLCPEHEVWRCACSWARQWRSENHACG